jgi:hypothetical protein
VSRNKTAGRNTPRSVHKIFQPPSVGDSCPVQSARVRRCLLSSRAYIGLISNLSLHTHWKPIKCAEVPTNSSALFPQKLNQLWSTGSVRSRQWRLHGSSNKRQASDVSSIPRLVTGGGIPSPHSLDLATILSVRWVILVEDSRFWRELMVAAMVATDATNICRLSLAPVPSRAV